MRDSQATFNNVCRLLLERGWFRDGDDRGTWRTPVRDEISKFDFGYSQSEAYGIQMARDGVNAQSGPQSS